jgi:hypothetical protein
LTSQLVGKPVIGDTMLRLGVPPHIGQSADSADDAARMTTALRMIRRIDESLLACWPDGLMACYWFL